MSRQGGGKVFGWLAMIASLAGVLAVASVFAAVWNYSAEGAVLVTGAAAGVAGAALGMQSRRMGGHWTGNFGLWLGVAMTAAGAIAVVAGEYTVEFG